MLGGTVTLGSRLEIGNHNQNPVADANFIDGTISAANLAMGTNGTLYMETGATLILNLDRTATLTSLLDTQIIHPYGIKVN